MIYFTSDLHFCHDRKFLYGPRGFSNIYDMNAEIIKNWNEVITEKDDVYVLGDIMLNDNEWAMMCLKALKGNIHIILGNHDTGNRINLYDCLENVVEITYATVLKYKDYHFYLSHYPTMTANLEKEDIKHCLINLYGHTHQKTNFYNDIPFMYHVGVDSHRCRPVSIDQIIEDIDNKVNECKEML